MGVEKQGSKGGTGGFLQLFDWNKKSRKKLFSNNSDFPDGSKQGNRSNSSLLVPRTHLIDEYDNGRSSIKGSSDYSCSSSLTDDEGNGIKAPGVVARLMGLDSMPTTSVVEPFSTPFFDSRSLQDGQYRRTPDFLYERQYMYSGKQPTKMDCFARNPVEVRPQKSLNRPIEKFQTEILPPKSAKSISITHHKLFSPIKSPGYIPTKNAAQIMEEAARMIDPGPHTTIKWKLPLVGSSVPLKFRDLTDKMEAVPRSSRFPEASQRPADSRLPEPSQRPVDSRAMKHLKGQSLSKSWNGVEEAPQFRSYPSEESNAAGLKNKGKSVSLAVQAKVNVQKRGGLNSSSSSSSQGKRELREPKLNQTSKSQLNSQKNTQKKPSTPSVSGVLRQNNQKQNSSTNRDKLASKSVGSNQQGRKTLPVEASFAQNKPLSKVAGNSKVGQRKSVLDTNDTEKVAPLSKTKNIPRKKRAIEGDSYLERSGFAETGLVNNDKKPVESNVAIQGHSKWMDDNRRKGMDVVSFTFTSPMKKPLPGQQASGLVVEKNTNFGVGCSYEQNPTDKNTTKILSLGLNVIGGDALNLLLEQKLRELTNGIESSSSYSVTPGNVAASASIQSDLVSDLDLLSATRMECGNRTDFGLRRESIYDSNCFSTEAHMLQGMEGIDENSVNSSKARKEFNCRHPSPVSVLEPCFSNESCNSSDSADSGSINDTMQCSSAQSEQVVDISCSKRVQCMGADTDLSESPSSICSGNFSRKRGKRFSLVYSRRTDKMELEYVREVISNADFMFKDLTLGRAHEMVNPHLFDLLENKKPWLRSNLEENIDSRISRRVLFDCVGECLDLRCRPYVNASCKKWAKGVAMVRRKGWLAEDIYKEIVGLRYMGNWMLDDLVDKDMSTGHGKWLDFETEEFELGEEIGRKILSSLVDEVVADILLI